ncbi:MAG: Eco57I restriction-modification methylase domain-containing protein [Verrucomicrobia bacterium]|nr:Eco57I restriction-modification methylase domain-containing protein [Verrucomicrobiota bacterium]MCH8527459.1 Eco57I restriction-modification methylase domain-containing protein [Kiritimatiellia bacterium]
MPQVLCEFKDIRSGLEARQNRKGNARSPVDQAFDYLQEAHASRDRDALVSPSWALVTDMREFRLYSRLKGKAQYQGFVLSDSPDPRVPALLGNSVAARFRRFVFWRLFQPDLLLAKRGDAALDSLLRDQVTREKAIEKAFYHEYRAYREHLYQTIRAANPGYTGSRGKLVRLTQRFLDRCIFILFCEDMGHTLRYPPELLRDMLIEESNSKYYEADDSACWDHMKRLFRAMRDGGKFGPHPIDRFNGGLFEEDPELESLHIPTKVYCAEQQGAGGGDSLTRHPLTLLYFSAAYNFGHRDGSGERVINLYTLGRIFEQSITELEIMEAEADERPSINKLTKRKTDGVYYTPEWVTHYLVENTVGTRLADIKSELGYPALPPLDETAIAEYRTFQKDKRRTAKTAGLHRDFLANYRGRLEHLRVVDPACGSGAFLIQALNRLMTEYQWIAGEQERLEGQRGLFDQDALIRSILSHNLYGVDINPESVEITKLALWLHTAAPGKPLCALDRNIRCGNSLVDPDFYATRQLDLFSEDEKERVNAFDWKSAFPEVFSHGGFDCVIGNPPYIKLQHFRRAQAEVAEYISNHYNSASAGNWDMYLPFIEKGVTLLHPKGRMGYIAPNVWMVNDYGQALRKFVKEKGALDRWLDFKSHQVFDEATTYTSLQFFRGQPSPHIACAFAPDGNIGHVHWSEAESIQYSNLQNDEAWIIASSEERFAKESLSGSGVRLGDVADGIFVGIQTSSNDVYHLEKIAPGLYKTIKDSSKTVELEDDLLHPLVKGPDTKRYTVPKPHLAILVPYKVQSGRAFLIPAQEMARFYPKTWAYLKEDEQELRKRENRKMDNDDFWWGYNYPKNIDKQKEPRLLVAGTAPGLRFFCDSNGEFTQDDRRVFAVTPNNPDDLWYFLGILNSPLAEQFFRTVARPKANGFFDIEKQFLEEIPIPDASPEQRQQVGDLAKELQDLHTQRRDLVDALDIRLNSPQTEPLRPKPAANWIWAQVGTKTSFLDHPDLPKGLNKTQIKAWSKARHEDNLAEQLDTLDVLLQPGATLRVYNTEDQITLHINDRPVLTLYDKPDTPFLAAQWRHTLRPRNVTQAYNGKKLLNDLLNLKQTQDQGLKSKILNLDNQITDLDQVITAKEAEMNEIVAGLYGLDAGTL